MSMSRIPVTVIEIDQDRCALSFGRGACPASGEPCYNTRATCKAPQAYTLGEPLTLRFSMVDSVEVFDEYVMPMVERVRTSPTRVNVGGRRGTARPLGIRAEADISMIDAPHSDILVDPYLNQRTFNPMERSTFWAKWLARNIHYNNRPLRIREGYVGQSLAEMQTRHYVLDKIDGPSSDGKVRIKALDILRLADDDKAQAPEMARGVLLNDLPVDATSFDVIRGTDGEYVRYNTNAVRIGDEVIRYSHYSLPGGGIVRFHGLQRGSDGTDVETHDAEDTVQGCLEYVNAAPHDIAYDLLTQHGNVPPEFIDYEEFARESNYWLTTYPLTRLITEPIGVTTLLGELSEQALFYIWWDERRQKVRFKAVAPTIGAVSLLTEESHILADSMEITVRPEQRASEVWVNFLPLDATETGKDRKHYRRTRVNVDPTASSDFEFRERRIYEIYSPWLTADLQASLLATRMLSTFREPPVYVKLSLDAKDRNIGVGDEIDIMHRGFVNAYGEPRVARYRVISAHEDPPGVRVNIEAQQSQFGIGQNFGLIAPNNTPNYSQANDHQKGSFVFIAGNNGRMPNGDDPYLII